MRMIVSIGLCLVLMAIAALHVYWGFGGLWPATTEQDIVKTVVGAPSLDRMPALGPTLAVAALIFSFAVIALSAGGLLSLAPHWLSRLAALAAGAVFVGRGVAGLARLSIFKTWIAEPFATLNAQFYSPLCLAIGAAFFFLAFANPERAPS